MIEKEYEFIINRTGHLGEVQEGEVIILKESELEDNHLSLLVGEMIHLWNKSPDLAKARFFTHLKETYK